jgi:hypothetical protein
MVIVIIIIDVINVVICIVALPILLLLLLLLLLLYLRSIGPEARQQGLVLRSPAPPGLGDTQLPQGGERELRPRDRAGVLLCYAMLCYAVLCYAML